MSPCSPQAPPSMLSFDDFDFSLPGNGMCARSALRSCIACVGRPSGCQICTQAPHECYHCGCAHAALASGCISSFALSCCTCAVVFVCNLHAAVGMRVRAGSSAAAKRRQFGIPDLMFSDQGGVLGPPIPAPPTPIHRPAHLRDSITSASPIVAPLLNMSLSDSAFPFDLVGTQFGRERISTVTAYGVLVTRPCSSQARTRTRTAAASVAAPATPSSLLL